MLLAMSNTSASSSGGSQRCWFSSSNAAAMALSLMPQWRIDPAKLVSVVLRAPSVTPPAAESGAGAIVFVDWRAQAGASANFFNAFTPSRQHHLYAAAVMLGA